MDIEKLIKMANQIGDFFEANPDTEQAKAEIANHLHRFWNSVMINTIVTHVNQHQGKGLHPRVAEAIKQHISV
jgi:formate dehydrogenase subunit delta